MNRKVNVKQLATLVICCCTLGITSARADLSLAKGVAPGITVRAVSSSVTLQAAETGTTNSTANRTSSDNHGLRSSNSHVFTFVPEPSGRLPLLGAVLAFAAFAIIRRRCFSVSRQ